MSSSPPTNPSDGSPPVPPSYDATPPVPADGAVESSSPAPPAPAAAEARPRSRSASLSKPQYLSVPQVSPFPPRHKPPPPSYPSSEGSSPHPPSPELHLNPLSAGTYWWMNSLIALGYKRPLEDSDMYELKPDVKAAYCTQKFEEAWHHELHKRKGDADYKPSLFKALFHIYGWRYCAAGILKAILDGLQFLSPILLEWFLKFIYESQYNTPPPDEWRGYVLAGAIGLTGIVQTFISNLYFQICMVIGVQVRTSLITALYRKSLRLSPGARTSMSSGQTINLMSTDTSKIDLALGFLHLLWSALEQMIIAIALLVRALGPSALAGIAVLVMIVPVQSYIMKRLYELRRQTVKFTDARVKLMNEILQGIRVIKVYAWEKSFLATLRYLRLDEMKFIRQGAYIRAYNTVIMQVGPISMSLLAFIVLGASGNTLRPEYIFSSLVLFNLLRFPLMMFPMSIAFASDAKIAMQRIQDFLLAEELHSEPEWVEQADFAIKVHNAKFSYELPAKDVAKESAERHGGGPKKQESTNTLVKVEKPVEVEKNKKKKKKKKDNENQKKDEEEKKEEDGAPAAIPFHLDNINITIPKGSLVAVVGAVGSGKSSLLGGILGEMRRDEGRVIIAGSVGYVPQQAWIKNNTLKNNILFGLPFEQAKYDEIIKVCALERDIAVLPAGDQTEIGEKGINLSGGQKQRISISRAVYFDADIILLDDPLSAVDAHVGNFLFHECIKKKLGNKTRVLVTHQLQYVSHCDYVIYIADGKIAEQGTYSELMNSKSSFFNLIETYVGDEQNQVEGAEEAVNDTEQQKEGVSNKKLAPHKSSTLKSKPSAASEENDVSLLKKKKEESVRVAMNLMQQEERTKGGVPWETFSYYFRALGSYFFFGLAIILIMIQQADRNWTDWWLSLWTRDYYQESVGFYLGIYAGLGLGQCVWAFFATMLSAKIGIDAAIKLHNHSFEGVLKAPISFFDTTPLGRIINRFSKDQDVIDTQLMETLRMIFMMLCIVLGTFIMIAVVTPFFLIPLAPIVCFYYYVQMIYRNSSREIKRLESISRSPLYAHFSETLTGLSTIRAYRTQNTFMRDNEIRMDGNNRPYYIQVISQRWLSLRLEVIGAFVSFFAALIVVIQRNSISAGSAGLSLSYSMSITALLNWLIRQTVEAENCMNSVERSKFYTDHLENERPNEMPNDDSLIQQRWPQRGEIRFENLKIRYREGLPLVLHGISATIRSGERVGIVGRTGAGKSSLMVALFRLVEAAEGKILLDDVDISTVGLHALRSSMAIITQDSVLFAGTVRSNLDPFKNYTDQQLWDVLQKTYLIDAIQKLELKLEAPVTDNGENFSVGQRAQFCLARAMLRNSRVCVLDEATASIDMETDALIQSSLRKYFPQTTILTIAHRLNTIVDYDRVMVLDFGLIKEFDTPARLLRDRSSVFSSMVDETGESNAAILRQIAYNKEMGVLNNDEAVQSMLHHSSQDSEKLHELKQRLSHRPRSRSVSRAHTSPDATHEHSVSQVTFHMDQQLYEDEE